MARSPAWAWAISAGAGKLRTSVALFLPRKVLFRRRRVESSARRTSTSPSRPTAVQARLRKRVRLDFESAGVVGLLGGSMVSIGEEAASKHQTEGWKRPLLMMVSHIDRVTE